MSVCALLLENAWAEVCPPTWLQLVHHAIVCDVTWDKNMRHHFWSAPLSFPSASCPFTSSMDSRNSPVDSLREALFPLHLVHCLWCHKGQENVAPFLVCHSHFSQCIMSFYQLYGQQEQSCGQFDWWKALMIRVLMRCWSCINLHAFGTSSLIWGNPYLRLMLYKRGIHYIDFSLAKSFSLSRAHMDFMWSHLSMQSMNSDKDS